MGSSIAPPTPKGMNANITHVALVVKKKDEAVGFYTKKVGFEKIDYNPPGSERWVTVGP